MAQVEYHSLDHGITCIDARYMRAGIACFYLLEHAGEVAIIETGTSHSVPLLEQVMNARGLCADQVRYIIPTHVHLDHAGGAGLMMARYPAARLLIHPRGARHMADPTRLVESSTEVYGELRFRQLYGEITPVPNERIVSMEDGDSVSLGQRQLEFRHTRGHADHHLCVWDAHSGGWFSGDMFGICYCWFRCANGDFVLPSTTPSQFDPDAYLASLALLDSYEPQWMYMTHYGALRYTREKSELLASQIAACCELAPTFRDDKPELERALTDYSLARIREFDRDATPAELRQRLAHDMDLNAQGLQAWLQRKARTRSTG